MLKTSYFVLAGGAAGCRNESKTDKDECPQTNKSRERHATRRESSILVQAGSLALGQVVLSDLSDGFVLSFFIGTNGLETQTHLHHETDDNRLFLYAYSFRVFGLLNKMKIIFIKTIND